MLVANIRVDERTASQLHKKITAYLDQNQVIRSSSSQEQKRKLGWIIIVIVRYISERVGACQSKLTRFKAYDAYLKNIYYG